MDLIIDREAREIIRLAASVRLLAGALLFIGNTWNSVQDQSVFVSNQGAFAVYNFTAFLSFSDATPLGAVHKLCNAKMGHF